MQSTHEHRLTQNNKFCDNNFVGNIIPSKKIVNEQYYIRDEYGDICV